MHLRHQLGYLVIIVCLILSNKAAADPLTIAVASNFRGPIEEITQQFKAKTGQDIRLSTASSGKLFAQIAHGAPFHVFLSADQTTPHRLEAEGFAVRGSRFTYAIGRLVLWSNQPGFEVTSEKVLSNADIERLAIANPKLAPYGLAAQQTLQKLQLLGNQRLRLILGENINQTYQFVYSGNVALGFVAQSQLIHADRPLDNQAWLVPQTYHEPIKQDAVLLTKGVKRPDAKAFLEFLQSPTARKIIEGYGYQLPD